MKEKHESIYTRRAKLVEWLEESIKKEENLKIFQEIPARSQS